MVWTKNQKQELRKPITEDFMDFETIDQRMCASQRHCAKISGVAFISKKYFVSGYSML